jgi:hypothetical protein
MTPVTTSQVSLPSQMGATALNMARRLPRYGQPEQHADAEIETVEQHVKQNADGQERCPEHDHG